MSDCVSCAAKDQQIAELSEELEATGCKYHDMHALAMWAWHYGWNEGADATRAAMVEAVMLLRVPVRSASVDDRPDLVSVVEEKIHEYHWQGEADYMSESKRRGRALFALEAIAGGGDDA